MEQLQTWIAGLFLINTYIQDRDATRVYDLFDTYKTKYGISDITNLRIASAERIIAMHNSERLVTTNYDECGISAILRRLMAFYWQSG